MRNIVQTTTQLQTFTRRYCLSIHAFALKTLFDLTYSALCHARQVRSLLLANNAFIYALRMCVRPNLRLAARASAPPSSKSWIRHCTCTHNTHMLTHTHTHLHSTCLYTHTHTPHTHIHIHTHTYTHTCTHNTHIHIHTFAHTQCHCRVPGCCQVCLWIPFFWKNVFMIARLF